MLRRLDKEEDGSAIPKNHHSQVGGAGGKGLLLSFDRWDVEDSGNDVNVGKENNHTRTQNDYDRDDESCHLNIVGVEAGKNNPGINVAVEVINHSGPTERESRDQKGWYENDEKSRQPRARCQLGRELDVHDGAIMQGITYG